METSRICVKNIPRSFTDRQLQDHFANFGALTDVKLMRTTNGNSRGFGFIGFANTSDAKKAVDYFHKTFIGTNRISVELARRVDDPSLDRPWSKYSKGSSRYRESHPEELPPSKRQKEVSKSSGDGTDEELKEFLDLMMPTQSPVARWEDPQSTRPTNSSPQDPEPDHQKADGIRRLFVRNLSYSTTEEDLIEAFGAFGELLEVHLVTDQITQKSKGFAFIEFENSQNANKALLMMDGIIFQGRLIHVLLSHNKRARSSRHITSDAPTSFKKEKEIKLKEHAGNRLSWNTLFIRPDTILDAISELYQISKSEIMEKEASDLGVRLALAETQILYKTKEDLESFGIDLRKLQEAAEASGTASKTISIPRSDVIMIVKNLPYHSDEDELLGMFVKFGEVAKFLIPSTRVLAIVQFTHSSDAKSAFQGLAYKKYKSVPIYLEWAPKGIFFKTSIPALPQTTSIGSMVSSIYVKNLAFSTRDEDLVSHFDHVVSEVGGELKSTKVARKTHKNGTIVSAGFGFIEVDSQQTAKHVIQKLNNSNLDGHIIELRRSVRSQSSTQRTLLEEDSEPSLKLIVKNLAFECNKDDLLKLFGPFGQIKTCRIPKKFDGNHRGFGFVEFVTKQEARNAKDKTGGVHLFGRRLKVEYSKDDVHQFNDI